MAIKSVKEVVYSILDKIEDILARITNDEADIETNKNNISNKVGKSGDTMTGRLTINTTDSAGVYYTNTGSSSAGTDTKLQATSWSGNSVWFGVGSGGSNRGIYDATSGSSAWICYKDSSDKVHLGNYNIGGNHHPIYLDSGVPIRCEVDLVGGVNGYAMEARNSIVTMAMVATPADSLTSYTVSSSYCPNSPYYTTVIIRYNSGFYFGCLYISTSGKITIYFYSSSGASATTVTSSSYTVYGYICYQITSSTY